MATEVSRNQVAMTDKGQVVVIEKTAFDANEKAFSVFEVRHGVRTIGEYGTAGAAFAVANAIAGIAPKPPKFEAKDE